MKGIITNVFLDKGFAFVRGEDGVSRFIHAKAVAKGMFDTLQKGKNVEFTPEIGDRGPRAVDVQVIIGE